MQKITIKNFGPITEIIDLEIKDLMVFIGPQATGKSTVAKLVWFFRKHLHKEIPIDGTTFQELLHTAFNRFFSPTFLSTNTFIQYTNKVNNQKIDIYIEGTLSAIYWEVNGKRNDISLVDLIKNYGFFELDNFYIPAGRSLIGALVNVSKSYLSGLLLGVSGSNPVENFIDRIFVLYLGLLENIKSQISIIFNNGQALNLTAFVLNSYKNNPQKAKLITESIHTVLGNAELVVDIENKEYIKVNSKLVPLHFASSGQQDMAGVLLSIVYHCIMQDAKIKDNNVLVPNYISSSIFIDEPESHLYPNSQKAIVELLAIYLNNRAGNQLIIPTHSPYILTSLNNLIFAYKTAQMSPEAAIEVNTIIAKEKWLNPEHVGVYYMGGEGNEGRVKSIINPTTGLIGVNELDDASDYIGDEFDAIMKIKRTFKTIAQ